MRWLILFWVTVAVCTAIIFGQDSSLTGSYAVEGKEEQQAYTGRADVTEADGVVILDWYTDNGDHIGTGLGIREGAVLSVVFKNAGGIGLISYRIDGSKLIGKWMYAGSQGVFPETLTKTDSKLHGADKKGPKTKI